MSWFFASILSSAGYSVVAERYTSVFVHEVPSAYHRQEAQSREIHLEQGSQIMVNAILKHMYGAEIHEVLPFVKSPSKTLRQTLSSTILEEVLNEMEWDLRTQFSGNYICIYNKDPESCHAQVAAEVSVELIRLYSFTDKYELSDLRDVLFWRLRSRISTAWNHSNVLDVIDEVSILIPENNKL